MSTDTLLEFEGVHFYYGEKKVLENVSFSIEGGGVYALIGPDGAGKTTLLKLAVGLLKPERGKVKLLGFDPLKEREKIVGKFGYMPQFFALYGDLTVEENLSFYARILGLKGEIFKERLKELLFLTGLQEFAKMKARALSGGMKRKLGLICNLLHTPHLLILDEPTTGIDVTTRIDIWRFLFERVNEGTTVFYSTPYLEEAQRAQRVFFLRGGRILISGSPAELKKKVKVRVIKLQGPREQLRRTLEAIPEEWIMWEHDGARITLINEEVIEKLPLNALRVMEEEPSLEDVFLKVLWTS